MEASIGGLGGKWTEKWHVGSWVWTRWPGCLHSLAEGQPGQVPGSYRARDLPGVLQCLYVGEVKGRDDHWTCGRREEKATAKSVLCEAKHALHRSSPPWPAAPGTTAAGAGDGERMTMIVPQSILR